jgi:hypothetical protein
MKFSPKKAMEELEKRSFIVTVDESTDARCPVVLLDDVREVLEP